MEKVVK